MSLRHVVIVNDFAYVNGGAGQVALSSALGLASRGIDVTVFSAVGPAMASLSGKRIHLVCTGQEEIAHDPNRLRAATQGLWNYRAARRMKETLAELDPSQTVVHLHGWSKSLSASIVHRTLSSGFRTVLTMHDYFLACPNGGFFDYRRNQICNLKPMSGACLRTNCDKHSYAEKLWRVGRQALQYGPGRLPSGVRDFIAISTFSRNILEPFLPPQAKIHEVPNPISTPPSTPARPEANRSFLFVGRLEPEKGPLLLAEAADRIGAEMMFVGDGSMRSELTRRYPSARFTGWVTPSEVAVHLESARAVVLPSRWYETQGLVSLEAAARGIPAVVPDRCAASEAISNRETGLIFRSGDAEDLADKLSMLQDDSLVATLGRTAYKRYWAAPATMEQHLDRLLEVYGQILSRTSRLAGTPPGN
jgi:glycosyltransferase involved in cell wall biosynthesis